MTIWSFLGIAATKREPIFFQAICRLILQSVACQSPVLMRVITGDTNSWCNMDSFLGPKLWVFWIKRFVVLLRIWLDQCEVWVKRIPWFIERTPSMFIFDLFAFSLCVCCSWNSSSTSLTDGSQICVIQCAMASRPITIIVGLLGQDSGQWHAILNRTNWMNAENEQKNMSAEEGHRTRTMERRMWIVSAQGPGQCSEWGIFSECL